MSPGRLCETAILTLHHLGNHTGSQTRQTPVHWLVLSQSVGRSGDGASAQVSARNIGSRGAARIFDYINGVALLIGLHQ
jgi:hypothetical protein